MPSKNLHRWPIAAILLAGTAAYGLSLKDGFVWDDNFQIVRNPFLHPGTPLSRLFTTDVWGYTRPNHAGVSNYYRPLQMLTYRLTAEWAGMKPAVFHAVNLGVHLLASVLVYAILWRITRRWSWAVAGAMLFVLHPVHTEAVIWISALTELGCALFYFAAFWMFLQSRSEGEPDETGEAARRRWPWLATSCVVFLIALFWKEMALTMPLVVGMWMLCFANVELPWLKRIWRASLATLPYWGVIGLYLLARVAVLGFFSRVQQPWQITPTAYVLTDIYLLGKYWTKMVVPIQLNAFYVFHPVPHLWNARALAAMVFLVASVVLIVRGIRRAPIASFAGAWTFATLIPVLALRQVGMNVFTDRYMYIPSLGFCLLLVWAGAKLAERWKSDRVPAKWLAVGALTVVAALYITQDIRRIPDWKSDYTLYAKTVEESPDSALMHNSFGEMLRTRGDLDGAKRQYILAIAVASAEHPPELLQVSDAYVGLAGVMTAQGHYDQAMDAVNQSLKLDPTWAESQIAKAVILMHQGHPLQARPLLLSAAKDDPNDEVVANALGVVALTVNEYPLAAAYFRKAVDILPDYPDALSNLGRAEADMGNYSQALPYLQRAVQLAPDSAVFHANLGAVLGQMGRLSEARMETERALSLDPNYAPARANLERLTRLQKQGGSADTPR